MICAEPSPDVATAISRSFALGLAASAQTPEGVSAQGALQVSNSLAQSMAQLGERTATIQLLRDSLYRACEAYANGALSSTSYALILSRFDVLAATMMIGEIGGGAFGRKLAAVSTVASTGGPSQADEAALTTAKKDLQNAEGDANKAKEELAKEPPASDDASPEVKQQKSTKMEGLANNLRNAQERENAARLNVLLAEIAQAGRTAAGGVASAAGGIDHTASKDIAAEMHAIQSDYLDHVSTDTSPLLATCISSLTGPPGQGDQKFEQVCLDNMPSLLGMMLDERKRRSVTDSEVATERAKALNTLAAAAASVCGNTAGDPNGARCQGILEQMSRFN